MSACAFASLKLLSLSFANPSNGTLTRTDDGRYLYRPASGFSGTGNFTYTVSDGQTSTTATITLDVDRSDDCSNSASVCVTSEWAATNQADGGYRYLVVNQTHGSSDHKRDAAVDDLPKVDWSTPVEAPAYATASTSNPWWEALGEETVLGTIDLAEHCGLMVKKPH